MSRAQELVETKVLLEFYPMINQAEDFDMGLFWSAVLQQQNESEFGQYEGSQQAYRLQVYFACQMCSAVAHIFKFVAVRVQHCFVFT